MELEIVLRKLLAKVVSLDYTEDLVFYFMEVFLSQQQGELTFFLYSLLRVIYMYFFNNIGINPYHFKEILSQLLYISYFFK